jgi:hypothetical protein
MYQGELMGWEGNEVDGYIRRLRNIVLYVSPFDSGEWSWSVTSTAPMSSIANHVELDSAKQTSADARRAAEEALDGILANYPEWRDPC